MSGEENSLLFFSEINEFLCCVCMVVLAFTSKITVTPTALLSSHELVTLMMRFQTKDKTE